MALAALLPIWMFAGKDAAIVVAAIGWPILVGALIRNHWAPLAALALPVGTAMGLVIRNHHDFGWVPSDRDWAFLLLLFGVPPTLVLALLGTWLGDAVHNRERHTRVRSWSQGNTPRPTRKDTSPSDQWPMR